jgi:hypothetical protein
MAGLGGFIGGLGNNTIIQMAMMQLVGQLVGAGIAPFVSLVQQESFGAAPLLVLSPADLASAVIRSLMTEAEAAHEAAQSGYDADRFHVLVGLTGQAPPPDAAAAARRRGLITQAEYVDIIAKGNMRPEYAELMQQLAVAEPSPTAVLMALLQGQVTPAFAHRRYAELGGNPDDFQWLFDSGGNAPTPTELLTMANRGVIPWDGTGPDKVSYEQGFLEGPWRNKWEPVFRALGEYLPPPRTVTAMVKAGSLSHDAAAALLAKQGLAPELVAAYLADASAQKTAGDKDLALGMVTTLYADRIITAAAATDMLAAIGYSAEEAGYVLAIQDAKLGQRFLSAAVGRIHTLYVGHKLALQGATDALRGIGIEEQAITDLVAIWDWERRANVKALTASEISAAYKLTLMDLQTATAELVGLGYTAYDAWLVLSIHMKAPQGTAPPPDA